MYMAARDNFLSILKAAPRRRRIEQLQLLPDVKYCLTPDQSGVIPVLRDGELVQVGPTQQILEHPADAYKTE